MNAKPTPMLFVAVALSALAGALALICGEAPSPTVGRDHDGRSFQ